MQSTVTNAAISVAAAGNANVAAANASAQARRAHVERCKLEMVQYQPQVATVVQMQSYAECVQFLHPTEAENAAGKWIIGALMVMVLLGAVIGFFAATYDRLMSTIGGALAGGTIWFGGVLFLAGIVYVFS
jgi:hypothetical protein